MKKIIKIDLSATRSGGKIYENQVNIILKDKFNQNYKHIVIKNNKSRILIFFRFIYIFFWLKFFFSGSLILSGATTYFAGLRSKNTLIIHHFDNKIAKGLLKYYVRFCELYLLKRKNQFNQIITVAEYWKEFFLKKNLKNIKVIYNCFDVHLYDVSENDIKSFKTKYNLVNKPIIYLGNAQYEKGTGDTYKSLKELDCFLITTGEPKMKLPVLNLKLKFSEYLILLKASNITVLMSKFPEGWNRIAHESILMGTPVIGSGMGGMSELLKKSNQIICTNLTELPKYVKQLLEKPPTNMIDAFNYAREFTIEKFKQEWLNIKF